MPTLSIHINSKYLGIGLDSGRGVSETDNCAAQFLASNQHRDKQIVFLHRIWTVNHWQMPLLRNHSDHICKVDLNQGNQTFLLASVLFLRVILFFGLQGGRCEFLCCRLWLRETFDSSLSPMALARRWSNKNWPITVYIYTNVVGCIPFPSRDAFITVLFFKCHRHLPTMPPLLQALLIHLGLSNTNTNKNKITGKNHDKHLQEHKKDQKTTKPEHTA